MITFTPTTADRILKLRHQVLRPGLPTAEVIFAEDQDQETRHYGLTKCIWIVFDGQDATVFSWRGYQDRWSRCFPRKY